MKGYQDIFAAGAVGEVRANSLVDESEPVAAIYCYTLDKYNKIKRAYQNTIPAKVEKDTGAGIPIWRCTKCGERWMAIKTPRHCCFCGKALMFVDLAEDD